MRKIYLTVITLFISSVVFGQTPHHINGSWLPFSDGSVYLNSHKDLGAGDIIFRTTGTNFYKSHMVIKGASGKIGIGTEDPKGLLDINGGWSNLSKVSFYPSEVRMYCPTGISSNTFPWGVGVAGVTGNLEFRSGNPTTAGSETLSTKVVFTPSGNIGIGTINPVAKLTVNGNLRATEIRVMTNVDIPDYVFESTYSLRSLSQVESYIKANKHLPEVPSAAEFKENGLDVAEMDALLLKKIEELTLYMIEMKKENEEIKEKSKQIEKANEEIRSKNSVLEKEVEILKTK